MNKTMSKTMSKTLTRLILTLAVVALWGTARAEREPISTNTKAATEKWVALRFATVDELTSVTNGFGGVVALIGVVNTATNDIATLKLYGPRIDNLEERGTSLAEGVTTIRAMPTGTAAQREARYVALLDLLFNLNAPANP